MRLLQNLVSARPSVSAASPQASSALWIQRRRTKPLRGGPTAPCLWGLNRPTPYLRTRRESSLAGRSGPRAGVLTWRRCRPESLSRESSPRLSKAVSHGSRYDIMGTQALTQLPQLRQNITDFQVLFRRNSLFVGPSSG